ncbi:MAG: nickel transporter permease [Pseudomonadota bacterium]
MKASVPMKTMPPQLTALFEAIGEWRQRFRSPLLLFGAVIVCFSVLVALLGPFFAPYDPIAVDVTNRLQPPSFQHPMGTDELGRDLFSRLLYGARISLGMGIMITTLGGSVGFVIGCISGFLGGVVDNIIMRLTDIVMSVPSLVLAMALTAALGPSLTNAMLALAFVGMPSYVRLARGQALSLSCKPYVQAAKAYGASPWAILRGHIFPNALPPILVVATLDVGAVILAAAALSFLGLGAQPPVAEWGAMVASGRSYLATHWWYPVFPGLAILVVAVGFNLIGDGLNDLLDPAGRARKS